MTDYRVRFFAVVESYPNPKGETVEFVRPGGSVVPKQVIPLPDLKKLASRLSDLVLRLDRSAPPEPSTIESKANEALGAGHLGDFRVGLVPSESSVTGWRHSASARVHIMLKAGGASYDHVAIYEQDDPLGTYQVVGLFSVEVVG